MVIIKIYKQIDFIHVPETFSETVINIPQDNSRQWAFLP